MAFATNKYQIQKKISRHEKKNNNNIIINTASNEIN